MIIHQCEGQEVSSLLEEKSCRNSLCGWKVQAGNLFSNGHTYAGMELYGILKEEWEQSVNRSLQRTLFNPVIVLKLL
jgi:hypothetical protein